MDILTTVVQALWIILPAYVANASAVIVGGGKPIDGGRTWRDGKRLHVLPPSMGLPPPTMTALALATYAGSIIQRA